MIGSHINADYIYCKREDKTGQSMMYTFGAFTTTSEGIKYLDHDDKNGNRSTKSPNSSKILFEKIFYVVHFLRWAKELQKSIDAAKNSTGKQF